MLLCWHFSHLREVDTLKKVSLNWWKGQVLVQYLGQHVLGLLDVALVFWALLLLINVFKTYQLNLTNICQLKSLRHSWCKQTISQDWFWLAPGLE